jgi:hypothetical protein
VEDGEISNPFKIKRKYSKLYFVLIFFRNIRPSMDPVANDVKNLFSMDSKNRREFYKMHFLERFIHDRDGGQHEKVSCVPGLLWSHAYLKSEPSISDPFCF